MDFLKISVSLEGPNKIGEGGRKKIEQLIRCGPIYWTSMSRTIYYFDFTIWVSYVDEDDLVLLQHET